MASVTVRGTATAAATPDEATLVVELTDLRPTALAAVLDGLGVDTACRSSAGVLPVSVKLGSGRKR